jgi:hypothetical protein
MTDNTHALPSAEEIRDAITDWTSPVPKLVEEEDTPTAHGPMPRTYSIREWRDREMEYSQAAEVVREDHQLTVRGHNERADNRQESQRRVNEQARREANISANTIDKERQTIRALLQELHEGEASFKPEAPELHQLLAKVFRLSALAGYANESEAIARGLGVFDRHSIGVALPDTADQREQEAEQILRLDHGIHPLDPRAERVWKLALIEAQNAGMCGEYEVIAAKVGVPTDFELAVSGDIEVTVSGTITVPFEGYATREQLQNGDMSDDALASFDIRDYIQDLDWEITDAPRAEFDPLPDE